jgi:hypothetical protein
MVTGLTGWVDTISFVYMGDLGLRLEIWKLLPLLAEEG